MDILENRVGERRLLRFSDGKMNCARANRGTMMSVSAAATGLGQLICASFGGFLLLQYGYNALGVGLGIAGILAALIFHLFSVDPIIAKDS